MASQTAPPRASNRKDPLPDRPMLLRLHQASFVLWFFVMVVHVLAHFLDTRSAGFLV